ncbi:Ger(x)C family spore germination protein [Paenibacillus sp. Marseille-Q4541]|uniref:Ger(x)C family spore germination protein n=1 Tax=Paenibacillus sp. Marseille-Q4541 TaxID=2831522 RepID=UPI001BA4A199|nr:Ger(x)C family spore germination protein [Paenibacillus sp. Marseille-Q4541]
MNSHLKIRSSLRRIAILILVFPLLSGCWDIKDINHRSLPVMMGISLTDEHKYKVFLDIPSTGETGSVNIVSETGETINDIIDRISMNMESQVDLLHLKIILVDKSFAQDGMDDIISGFMRSRNISSKTLLVISDESLDDFFGIIANKPEQTGNSIYDFFEKNAGWNPQMTDTRIWQVFRSIHSYTRDVVVPIVRAGKSTNFTYLGSAIIKNGKMQGQLTAPETLMTNAYYGESVHGKIEVMDEATVQIMSNELSHKTWMKDDQPFIRSSMKLKVTILETKGHPSEEDIKKNLEKMLKLRLKNVLQKSIANEADILAIGQLFRTQLPRAELRKWREKYYPHLDYELEVKTIIENRGNLKSL